MNKKNLLMLFLFLGMLIAQSFTPIDHGDDEKHVNLKILPDDISGDELHHIMRGYARALGVKCGFCHVQGPAGADGKSKWDFASDAKEEKLTARRMMKMVEAINKKYLDKMSDDSHQLEHITCVTCHMGRTKPIINVDSLKKS